MAFQLPPHDESLDSLYNRLESKVYELTATVPVPHSRTVTREKLQYYRDVLVDKARDLLPQVQALMDQYDLRETDAVKAKEAWRFGEKFIEEAYEWFNEVEEVYRGTTLSCSPRTTTGVFMNSSSRWNPCAPSWRLRPTLSSPKNC